MGTVRGGKVFVLMIPWLVMLFTGMGKIWEKTIVQEGKAKGLCRAKWEVARRQPGRVIKKEGEYIHLEFGPKTVKHLWEDLKDNMGSVLRIASYTACCGLNVCYLRTISMLKFQLPGVILGGGGLGNGILMNGLVPYKRGSRAPPSSLHPVRIQRERSSVRGEPPYLYPDLRLLVSRTAINNCFL